MIHIQAPNSYQEHKAKKSVFLAGSIEMGVAELWQDRLVKDLEGQDILIFNPRRDDWDASWEQTIENTQFREQVEWELNALEDADKVVFYFSPGTKSPITLLEFGIFAKANPEKMICFCPEGFWRKGNVDIVANKYGVKQVNSFAEMVELI